MSSSPYALRPEEEWRAITEGLVRAHPVSTADLVSVSLLSWADVFQTRIGGYRIGHDLFPSSQIVSFLLHELIAQRIAEKYPGQFVAGRGNKQKDIHSLIDPAFSIEIKGSSSATRIYGNRSYAQQQAVQGAKSKDGYYLTMNFPKLVLGGVDVPPLGILRFGYLEHSDWIPQRSATGQQASLKPSAYAYKLIELYRQKDRSEEL